MLELIFILILAGALLCFATSKEVAKLVSLITTGALFIILLYVLGNGSDKGGYLAFNYPFTQLFKSRINFSADGLSMLMLILTALIGFCTVIYYFNKNSNKDHTFYGLVLLMLFGLIGVFTAHDGFFFYLFWEITLIPIWLIAGIYSSERKKRFEFTTRFFVYTFVGSLFMLGGLLYAYQYSGDFSLPALYHNNLNEIQQNVVFWLVFIAFAVKLPLFPFHSWQPDTYTYSPTGGTVLLSGVMLKMAVYGILRYLLPIVPIAVKGISGDIVIILAVIGIIYGALIAIVKYDIKRIFAYSSFSHVGLMVAGIFSAAIISLRHGIFMEGALGAILQAFAHGITISGLFFAAGHLIRIHQDRNIGNMGGVARYQPVFSVLFFIILLGSMAVPLTNGFPGEFLLLKSVWEYNSLMGVLAGLTVILSAVYMLRVYVKTMFGEPTIQDGDNLNLVQSHNNELFVLGLLALGVLVFGLFPNAILNLIEAPITEIFKTMLRK